jgi:hypothetical protein
MKVTAADVGRLLDQRESLEELERLRRLEALEQLLPAFFHVLDVREILSVCRSASGFKGTRRRHLVMSEAFLAEFLNDSGALSPVCR